MERNLRRSVYGLIAFGLILGGGLLGYRWSNSRHKPTRATAAITITPARQTLFSLAEPPQHMPDLVGLDKHNALEALADIGVDQSNVTFVDTPYVGTPGLVVMENPVRGTDNPKSVRLSMSTPATMPDLKGETVAAATKTVSAFGAIVVQQPGYFAGVAANTVVGTDPDVGAPVPPQVTMRIAVSPSSVFLTALKATSGGCSTGSATASGQTKATAMTCRASSYSSSDAPKPAATYLMSGADLFTSTIGISDSDTPGTTARLRIEVDGVEKVNQIVTWGTPLPVSVVTTGGRRLDIYVSAPTSVSSSWDGANVVFLEPTLLGSPDAINKLGSSTP